MKAAAARDDCPASASTAHPHSHMSPTHSPLPTFSPPVPKQAPERGGNIVLSID